MPRGSATTAASRPLRAPTGRAQRARILAGRSPIAALHIRLDGEAANPAPALVAAVKASEAQALALALAESGGRRAGAARRLGISERTLRYKLAEQAGRPRAVARPVLQ